MSFIESDSPSRAVTTAIILIAIVAAPLACLAALEGFIVFGLWEGWALVFRVVYILSPIYVFLCLGLARRANRRGMYRKAIACVLLVAIPAALVLAALIKIASKL